MPTIHSQTTQNETILVALCGMSPAVLTETVWAWIEKHPNETPDRVITITTTEGRDRIIDQIHKSGVWSELISALESKTKQDLSQKLKFGITPNSIYVIPSKDCTHELSDVSSLEDHEAVGDFFLERLRTFTENDHTKLIVSIAGGRKTMGALLYSVMNIIGRKQDVVNHILVNSPWERIPSFFFPGCKGPHHSPDGNELDSQEAQLQLAEIPFIPLRHLFEKEKLHRSGNYSQLVDLLQSRVIELSDFPALKFDSPNNQLRINEDPVQVSKSTFGIMLFFAHCKLFEKTEKTSQSNISDQEWSRFLENYETPEDINHWTHNSSTVLDPKEDVRKAKNHLKDALNKAGIHTVHIQKLLPDRRPPWFGVPNKNITILKEN